MFIGVCREEERKVECLGCGELVSKEEMVVVSEGVFCNSSCWELWEMWKFGVEMLLKKLLKK